MGGLSLRKAREKNWREGQFELHKPRRSPPEGAVYDLTDDDTLAWAGIVDPEWLHVIPYGIGKPGDMFWLRMWGWSVVQNPTGDEAKLLIPLLLAGATVTLGNIDASAVDPGALMADAITTHSDNRFATVAAFDHGQGLPASLTVHARSCRLIEFEFANSEAKPVKAMNAFWKVGR